MNRTVLVRCDASVSIGTGHVMRCLALAQAWQDAGGRAVFAMARSTPAVIRRLRSESCDIVVIRGEVGHVSDAVQTTELARELDAAWLIIDGYYFGTEYQKRLKLGGIQVLLVDDKADAESYSADLILNQNVHAHEDLYRNRTPRSKLLLGARYCLLRREFQRWRGWRRTIAPHARKVMITMGGSDPGNASLCVIEALREYRLADREVTVIVGGSNPHHARIESAVHEFNGARIVQDAANMAELLAGADIAIAAAGTTCWEMCLVGLPALLVVLSENQKAIAEGLAARGVARNLGPGPQVAPEKIREELEALTKSPDVRQRMSDLGRSTVDGRGAARIVARLCHP
jgi:UDP-2,4-diacetamido-2,4,6-trideoxy-beta-L-altropyranose hydrolase